MTFPVLHGPWGEDGTIQGLFETLGLPYVGSGVFASAAGMDKGHMKAMFRIAGLPVGPYEVVSNRDWITNREATLARVAELGFPLFVKPARAGSSLGISKVRDEATLVACIEQARLHDPRLVIEAGFEGVREVECGVLIDADGIPRASVCAEIIVKGNHEFYDFDAKYLDDSADLVVPAQLDAETTAQLQRLAILAFDAVAGEGLARVDFFVCADGSIIINARTDRMRKIVIESGGQGLRQWRNYERDIRADFEAAFGEGPGEEFFVASALECLGGEIGVGDSEEVAAAGIETARVAVADHSGPFIGEFPIGVEADLIEHAREIDDASKHFVRAAETGDDRWIGLSHE